MRHVKRLLIPLWLLVLLAACAAPPAILTPESRVAFQNTRVIKGLDLLRDMAVDANDHQMLSTDSTRKVVVWHQTALRIIHASGTGWKSAVGTSLDELMTALPAADKAKLSAYAALIKTLLTEVQS